MGKIVAGQTVMSLIIGGAAEGAAEAVKAEKRRLYPLRGTVSGIEHGMTGDAEPKPYATFRFTYGVSRGGKAVMQTRNAKAVGKSAMNIRGALVEGGDARLLCLFDRKPEGETLVAVGMAGQGGQAT